MKRFFTAIFVFVTALSPLCLIAGGIVTNTNQSASYIRMPARDASTEIDAVFYNPAGLSKLSEGLHFSLNNQTIFQEKKIASDYPFLNSKEYIGDITVPLYPGIYAAYKMSDFVFSLGFNPTGGGGSAEYKKGLPSFEMNISDLVPALQSKGVTKYNSDLYFEGSSIYLGTQAGVTYQIDDWLSVFAGARYIMAENTYLGHIKSNTLFFGENPMAAPAFFNTAKNQYAAGSAQFYQMGDSVRGKLYADSAAMMGARAFLLSDQEADVIQKATGITPIIGLNFSLLDHRLNIGVKYELKTKIELKNETKKDLTVGFLPNGTPVTQFPDGAITNADIPALLNVGVSYLIMPEMTAHAGLHYYWDKDANWDGKETKIDKNFYEFALGLEYQINEQILVSAGYLYAATGVSIAYNTDMSYSLSSNSVGFGGKINVSPLLDINAGVLFSMYNTESKPGVHKIGGTGPEVNYKEDFYKSTTVFAIGLDFHLFGN